MTPGLRRLYAPEPVTVRADPGGGPRAVGGVAVEAVREEWVVDDRWWIPGNSAATTSSWRLPTAAPSSSSAAPERALVPAAGLMAPDRLLI